MIPRVTATLAVGWCIYLQRKLNKRREEDEQLACGLINCMIGESGCPKVVDTVYVDELGDRKSVCRCWASKKVK